MSETSTLTLILGHAASGKSAWAERHVEELGGTPVYVATARILDDEMRRKVDMHATRRGARWRLVETDLDLAGVSAGFGSGEAVLIDCATMWLTNLLMDNADCQTPATAWIDAMATSAASFVVVSNDVGGGIVPDNSMGRQFQRMQGELNQRLAAAADRVVLVTAGLPQVLK